MTVLFILFAISFLLLVAVTYIFYRFFIGKNRLSSVKKLDKIKYIDFDLIPFGFKSRSLLALPKIFLLALGITLIAGFAILLIGVLVMFFVNAFG